MHEAKLFINGSSQAVRLPKEFRFAGESVYVKRLGNGVLLLPKGDDPWETMFMAIEKFPNDFLTDRMDEEEQERPGLEEAFGSAVKRRRTRGRPAK